MLKRKLIFLLFAGHLVTDICQGAVPALLPFFISDYHLSYSAAGFLVLAVTISSSVVQPLSGYLSDRVSIPGLIALGPFLAGLGIALAGVFHDYHLILISVSICGIGVAIFHPEGARMANRAIGERKASGMSIFSVGGNIGFALGPIVTAGFVLAWGLKGTLLYLVPVLIVSVVLLKEVTRFSDADPQIVNGGTGELSCQQNYHEAWVPFWLIVGAIVCRSIIFQGLNTFLPNYWIHEFHQSKAVASTALTLMFGMGAIGNLIGGRLADRFGSRKTVLIGFLVLIPLMSAFIFVKDVTMLTLLLLPIGFTIFLSFSPIIVMGQQCLPGRVGFASGITIGLAVSIGGFAAPLLGKIADQSGIHAVFNVLVILPVLAAALIYLLPRKVPWVQPPRLPEESNQN